MDQMYISEDQNQYITTTIDSNYADHIIMWNIVLHSRVRCGSMLPSLISLRKFKEWYQWADGKGSTTLSHGLCTKWN